MKHTKQGKWRYTFPKWHKGRSGQTDELQWFSRISAISGRLQSKHGWRNGRGYRLLVDGGAAIDLIERELLKKTDNLLKFTNAFVMEKDKHQTTEEVYIEYLGKKQLFRIIPDNFPIPEDGIIGVQFFTKM